MLTIQGNREVAFNVRLVSIDTESQWVLVEQTIEVEGEPLKSSLHRLLANDTLRQHYRIELTGTPLMQADLLAMLRDVPRKTG